MHTWRLKQSRDPSGLFNVSCDVVPVPDLSSLPWSRAALVRVQASALNHRDNWITKGMYPRIMFDRTLGADGCGIVEAVTDGMDKKWKNERVVIDSALNWGDNDRCPGNEYSILGMPTNGTFAEYVVVPVSSLRLAPGHLTPLQCAALPLAGITAYRATFTKGLVTKGSQVLVTGIGGGVALFALQFAVAVGASVFVTSSSQEKIEKAIALGAVDGVNYREDGWTKQLKKKLNGRRFDAVIDGAGGNGLNGILRLMQGGGIISSYGSTAGPPDSLMLPLMFINNVELRGSAMGSPNDFDGMLKLINSHKIVPLVDQVFPFASFPAALDRMRNGKQFGKIVLDHEAIAPAKL